MGEGHRATSMDALGRLTPEAFAVAGKLPLRFVLDNLRSGLNVGSVSAPRTPPAGGHRPLRLHGPPAHRDILKTALGATDHVAWAGHEDAVRHWRSGGGVKVFALEQASASTGLDSGPGWRALGGGAGTRSAAAPRTSSSAVDGVLEIPIRSQAQPQRVRRGGHGLLAGFPLDGRPEEAKAAASGHESPGRDAAGALNAVFGDQSRSRNSRSRWPCRTVRVLLDGESRWRLASASLPMGVAMAITCGPRLSSPALSRMVLARRRLR